MEGGVLQFFPEIELKSEQEFSPESLLVKQRVLEERNAFTSGSVTLSRTCII